MFFEQSWTTRKLDDAGLQIKETRGLGLGIRGEIHICSLQVLSKAA